MFETYQRETKSYEFLQDTNREDLKTGKIGTILHFAMASLCNGFSLKPFIL